MLGSSSQFTRRFRFSALILWLILPQITLCHSNAQAGSPTTNSISGNVDNSETARAISAGEEAANKRPEPGDVVIDGRKILSVYDSIGNFTAKDRAEKISERISTIAHAGAGADSIALTPRPTWTEISANGQLLLAITDGDASAANMPRPQLATQTAENIRGALTTYRREHSLRAVLWGIAYSALTTFAILPMMLIIRRIRLHIRRRLEKWIEGRKAIREKETALHVAGTYLVSSFLALGSLLRWLILIALFETYVTVLLSFFPQTRAISYTVTAWILSALRAMGESALAYLPNLFIVALIIVVASQISRLITMLFLEIKRGNLTIAGFYPDWAEPTAKLIKVTVLALVMVIIFPYLPGSKSPAFQGISIFVGVLLSLGSSSAVANVIAGVILTYMRSFSVGDWVKIGDTVGEIREKSLLVTRILTPKQETITIPNATVMSGSVMNFTGGANNAGVIFHTTVTIGYDAPWKTVHQLLIDAAMATEGVLHKPAPFVLQTALNDFYVSYELNAHTDVPRRMQFIYSDLHQNIQDRFNEAGMEICSPHFAALRDGNTIAIPAKYISHDYTAPGFRVDDVDAKEAPQTIGSRR